MTTFEICVDSVAGTVAAETAGADRVELCAALFEGGLTPTLGMVERTLERTSTIRVHPIVRPRGGDFLYDEDEIVTMERDIDLLRAAGVHGIVIGALTPTGDIDVETVRRLLDRASGLSVTFHRAFDMTRDPLAALDTLIALGIDRVLTSGREATALDGVPLIAGLVQAAGDRIVVMPGSGIHARNVARILDQTGAIEVHFSASESVDSAAVYRNSVPHMGGRVGPPEFTRKVTTVNAVTGVLSATVHNG